MAGKGQKIAITQIVITMKVACADGDIKLYLHVSFRIVKHIFANCYQLI